MVDQTARSRVVGITTTYTNLKGEGVNFLPQRVALVGQGSTAATYALDKVTVLSALQVGQTYGFGSPLHLAALQLLPDNGDGLGGVPLTVYPLEDDGSGVASAGDITPTVVPTEAGSYIVRINNIDSAQFVISVGDVVADVTAAMTLAINANLNMPMIAVDGTTVVDLTSKWAGASANDLTISVIGSATIGNSFAITQPVGGLVNPDVDTALALMGNVWETLVVNCLDVADTATLTKYTTFGEGRWGPLVKKPLIVFTGNTETTVASATAVSDARKTDRINAQIVAPGSDELPFVLASRAVARVAVQANNNPPVDYARKKLTGLTPGADGDQWDYTERDAALKLGSSTITVDDKVISLSDTITFYHPTGDTNPAYRYVVNIIKLQNIIYGTNLIFDTEEWDGAPLVPDDQPVTNAAAKQPKMAIAEIASFIDALASEAIISDPKTAKATITAAIDGSNSNRLNIAYTVQLSGNVNIVSVNLNFGFFFGGA